jgi:hypothetical protein
VWLQPISHPNSRPHRHSPSHPRSHTFIHPHPPLTPTVCNRNPQALVKCSLQTCSTTFSESVSALFDPNICHSISVMRLTLGDNGDVGDVYVSFIGSCCGTHIDVVEFQNIESYLPNRALTKFERRTPPPQAFNTRGCNSPH